MADNVVKLPGQRDPAREDLVELFEGFLKLAKDGELDTACVAAQFKDGRWAHEFSASMDLHRHIGSFLLLLLEMCGVTLASMDRHGFSG